MKLARSVSEMLAEHMPCVFLGADFPKQAEDLRKALEARKLEPGDPVIVIHGRPDNPFAPMPVRTAEPEPPHRVDVYRIVGCELKGRIE